ncbi:MAG: NAD-dependent dihydropyrimidine dehydrogenase subunit PreA [Clostridia bacterium]
MRTRQDLSIDFCGKHFVNPFTVAASPPSDTRARVERAFEAGWGGAVFKTTSVESEIVDLVYPMMGGLSYKDKRHAAFYNIDLISERHIDEICTDIRYLKAKFPEHRVIGSIMASTRAQWEELVSKLEKAGVDMIECSMSCPQGEGDGTIPVNDPTLTREVTGWIKSALTKDTPIIVKLAPIVTDLSAIGHAAKEGGADALCAIDTVRGFSGINLDTLEPRLSVRGKSTFCGMSGPAIKPIAMACIAEIAQNVGLPVAGVGGLSTWQDAAEFLLLGASNLQVCTAIIRYGYEMVEDLQAGLSNYMEEKDFKSLQNMVGQSLNTFAEHENLDREVKVVSSINSSTCIRDNACYIACRDGGYNAISLTENGPVIDETKCRGCGVCQSVCPVGGCMVLKRK